MPFPPINLHPRISSPGKELFRKKKTNTNVVPPQSLLGHKSREEKDSEKDQLSTSWPSANLKQMGRKPQQQGSKDPTVRIGPSLETDGKNPWLGLPKPLASSCDSVPRSSSGESAARRSSKYSSRNSIGKEEVEQEIQFSLSLTPEAILVIQKRNLEKQMMAKQQKCCASADLRHRRVFPSKRAQSSSKNAVPMAKLETPNDISTIVKISLLNDQYKYDDVEYEEEDGDVDETVMRKCKEWLKGVESAAAFGKVDKLSSLPHLKSC
ncbi:proline-rich protein 18 [Chanos chanos]|uniref:Proline-rich protein 18 n=1 Tax=Chanos chanos TaxID=29144 RepID=A0A6J2V903_CHACN|nr:proline-rich protein 18 [Chanos chanos]